MRRALQRTGALIVALALLGTFPSISAMAREASLDEYITMLKTAADAAPAPSEALTQLKSVTSVTTPTGSVTVENSWMTAGSPNLKSQLEAAIVEAEKMRAGLPPSGAMSPEDQARDITDSTDFHPQETLLDKVRKAIGRAFGQRKPREINPRTGKVPSPSGLDLVVQIFVYLLLAAILGVVIYLIWKQMRKRGAGDEVDEEEEVWGIGPANPEELGKMAQKAAAEGRFSDAVRAFYLANLVRLDRKGVINFDPAATNGQFRRRLAGSFARAVPPFDNATFTFERIHYGGEIAAEADWQSSQSEWRNIWTGIET